MQTTFRKVAVFPYSFDQMWFLYTSYSKRPITHSLTYLLSLSLSNTHSHAHNSSLYLSRHLLLTFFCCSHSIQICLVFVSPFGLFFSADALTLVLRDVVENTKNQFVAYTFYCIPSMANRMEKLWSMYYDILCGAWKGEA